MATRILTFVPIRQTKGTFVFQEVDPVTQQPLEMTEATIGTLYLRKAAATELEYTGGGLVVTIETTA